MGKILSAAIKQIATLELQVKKKNIRIGTDDYSKSEMWITGY